MVGGLSGLQHYEKIPGIRNKWFHRKMLSLRCLTKAQLDISELRVKDSNMNLDPEDLMLKGT